MTRVLVEETNAPEITFTLDPAQTTFSKGDNLELKCSGQGNPGPTLILTTKRETTEDLTNVQAKELNHTLTLGCMDTGVYVCSGENNRGTNRTEISIGVRCPQQLSPLFNSKPQVDAAIREAAKFGIEIYGFLEPSTLTLQRTDDDRNLITSPRQSVEYTADVALFGVVNVTISDVVETDYTNYTLTVDNGLGNALNYTFYLNEGSALVSDTRTVLNSVMDITRPCGYNAQVLTGLEKGQPDPMLSESALVSDTRTVLTSVMDIASPCGNYSQVLTVNATKVESSGDDNDIYIIVGICVGLAVLILVAVAVVVLYRRTENGSILKEPDHEEKINEVYGASNDVKSKAENGDVFRKSDIDLKPNPVYVSSGEAQAENGVAQRESDCVMKANIVYGTSSEAQGGDPDEVIHKNPVYGSHFAYTGRKGTVKQSRDYTQLEPTITSASAAPANMKMAPPENDADPYEDVGNVKKSKPLGKSKQSVAPKPSSRGMAPQKPGSSPTFQVQQVGSSDELYAMVSLTNKGNKRTATPEPDEEEQDKDFLPDPSTRPDVPVKQFEEGDARARGSDIPEQPYGNFQSVQAETSESDKSHTNGSFLPDETEDNVYANTGAVGMRS
ncbi:hypothetical protein RRG08_051290 [Elysia crispata]|uniref:Ig-like domain-containing protein n=1 Tax=Elysia crispata TaxID=231223 RepID=A0AAE0XSC4_9GAST|nr:hypothetical protein RRG08_051290 [Elysia crispata]